MRRVGEVKLERQSYAKDIVSIFTNIKENGEWIKSELEKALNDVVVSTALSTHKCVLMRAVAHYYFVTRYALNMINFLYSNEANNISEMDRKYKPNKKQEEYLNENDWLYVRILNLYGSSKSDFEKNVGSIVDIILPKDEVEDTISMYSKEKTDITDNLPEGFIGSAIYSIRLMFAQWEADRHKDLKDKKKLLELRLLHYRMLRDSGQSDVSVEKEIEDLQKRVTDLDYKISKIEEDING